MKRILSFLILTLMLVSTLNIQVEAGEVSTALSLMDENGKLNVTSWYDPNDELEVQNGKLIIPDNSTADTRIITKSFATLDSMCEIVAEVSCNVEFTKLPEGKKFIIALGLSSIESYSGDAKNIEVEFTNQNGVSVGVAAYEKSGEATIVAAPTKCTAGIGSKMAVKVVLKSNQQISVFVNESEIVNGTVPVSGEGRVGLIQTGECGAVVSDLIVKYTQYDTPENTDFTETFEEGIYNNNLFTMKFAEGPRKPSYMAVEEYNGSKVLLYRNTGLCYLGTKHMYSNFELTFDIPYFERQVEKDENGNIVKAPSMFAVSMGDAAQDFAAWEYTGSTDLVLFLAENVYSYNHTPAKFDVAYSNMGFFDKTTDEGFSVQMKMVDGHFTLGMKALDDENFKTIAEADYDNFMTGYIKLWTTGDGNVAIDNVKIKNLDENPNLIEVPFEPAVIEVSDFEYEEPELVFSPDTNEESGEGAQLQGQTIAIYTVAGCGIVFAVSAVVMFVLIQRKKKEMQEVTENEA